MSTESDTSFTVSNRYDARSNEARCAEEVGFMDEDYIDISKACSRDCSPTPKPESHMEGNELKLMITTTDPSSTNLISTTTATSVQEGPRLENQQRSVHTISKPHILQTANQRPDEKIVKHQYKSQLAKQIEEQRRLKEKSLCFEKEQEEKRRKEFEEDKQKLLMEQQNEAERRKLKVEAINQREEATLQRIESARRKAQEEKHRRVEEKRHVAKPKGTNLDGDFDTSSSSNWMNTSTYSNPHEEQVIIPKTTDFKKLLEEKVKEESQQLKNSGALEHGHGVLDSPRNPRVNRVRRAATPIPVHQQPGFHVGFEEEPLSPPVSTRCLPAPSNDPVPVAKSSLGKTLTYLRELKKILEEEEQKVMFVISRRRVLETGSSSPTADDSVFSDCSSVSISCISDESDFPNNCVV